MNRDQIAEVIAQKVFGAALKNLSRSGARNACLAAADAIMALDGWQTIDSAPRDGTRVLTYSPSARKYGYEPVRANVFLDDAWQRSNQNQWPPTHWRPLPQPPGGAG